MSPAVALGIMILASGVLRALKTGEIVDSSFFSQGKAFRISSRRVDSVRVSMMEGVSAASDALPVRLPSFVTGASSLVPGSEMP